MGVPISNVTRRVVYTASGTGPYSFTFEILANTDIAVYKDDTLLTLTTDYTVTINSNGTGSITLTASPTGATQIAIVGNRTIQRTTDFVTGGDFFANTVNDEMDQQTIFAQQNAEAVDRALKAPQTDPTSINMTLPRKADRAGKLLSFNSDGNPVASDSIGNNRGNWASATAYLERDLVKDSSNSNIYQCKTSHTSTGTTPISTNTDSAKWYLLVDAASATASASAAAASEAAAAASESAAAASASSADTDATTTAASAAIVAEFAEQYLGAKASDPSVDNDGNALITGALYFNSTANEMRVRTSSGTWATAYIPATGYLSSGDIGSTVQAFDSNLTAFVTAFALPTTDGVARQALVTDGAGNISFGTAGVTTGKAFFFSSFN